MRQLISVILAAVALQMAGCDLRNEMREKRDSRLLATVENASGDSDWKHLIEASTLIAVGSVDEFLYVQDPTKLFAKGSANGIEASNSNEALSQLPNLREAVKGVMLRFRVEKLIFNRHRTEPGGVINVYVKNGYAPPTDSKVPMFASGKRYLVFLSPMEKADEVRKGLVVQSLDLSKESFNFDYKSAFKVTGQSDGYLLLTDPNESIIEEVKRALIDSP